MKMEMSNEMLEVMKCRRSIRKFTEEKLTGEEVEKILKAGLLAPSSKNKRPVELILVENRETIKALKNCKNMGTVALDTAPCAIAVIADTRKSDVWVEDASIAAAMMMLEAESLSLGSVWIQIRNRRSDSADSEAEVRKVLHIPEYYGVLNILALGRKAEEKAPYTEEDINLSSVRKEQF